MNAPQAWARASSRKCHAFRFGFGWYVVNNSWMSPLGILSLSLSPLSKSIYNYIISCCSAMKQLMAKWQELSRSHQAVLGISTSCTSSNSATLTSGNFFVGIWGSENNFECQHMSTSIAHGICLKIIPTGRICPKERSQKIPKNIRYFVAKNAHWIIANNHLQRSDSHVGGMPLFVLLKKGFRKTCFRKTTYATAMFFKAVRCVMASCYALCIPIIMHNCTFMYFYNTYNAFWRSVPPTLLYQSVLSHHMPSHRSDSLASAVASSHSHRIRAVPWRGKWKWAKLLSSTSCFVWLVTVSLLYHYVVHLHQ